MTDHNLSVLRSHGVDHLTYSELCQLLFQNDPWLLPEVSASRGKGGPCMEYGKDWMVGKYGNTMVEEKPRTPS